MAILLCLAGCSKGMSPREKELADQQNALNAQIERDWDNLVNETAPMRAVLNEYDGMMRNMQAEQRASEQNEAAEDANQAQSK